MRTTALSLRAVTIVVLTGVSGAGKTTVGERLAAQLNLPFFDGDDFHPPGNVAKMRAGRALTDGDRAGWLARLQELIRDVSGRGQSAIVACSALKQRYRERLAPHGSDVMLVYLDIDYPIARERLLARESHFMKAELLQSQFDALEAPDNCLTVDAAQDTDIIVQRIRQALASSRA